MFEVYLQAGVVKEMAKQLNFRYNGKSVLTCQHDFIPFYTSAIYDTYIDGCVFNSATYISNPNVVMLYM